MHVIFPKPLQITNKRQTFTLTANSKIFYPKTKVWNLKQLPLKNCQGTSQKRLHSMNWSSQRIALHGPKHLPVSYSNEWYAISENPYFSSSSCMLINRIIKACHSRWVGGGAVSLFQSHRLQLSFKS